MKYRILVILAIAFLIRLIALNQSLWLDEAVTANVVKNLGFFQIITKFSPTDFHPPLYYLFMKLWTNIFGYSEVALRFPSVVFSLLTGYLVYKIASLFHGSIAGVFAMAFFLFNPLIIYYSQEARMYMMATFFLTGALYYFISNIKNQISKTHIKNQIFFNLLIFLSLLTFYGSIFLVAAFLLYFLYKRQYKNLFICLFVVFIYFLTISPLLNQQVVNSKIALAGVANWSLVLGKANLKNLLLIPIKFSIGRISFLPKWLYWGIAGIWTTFIWFFIIIQKSKGKSPASTAKRGEQKYNSKVKSLICLLIAPLILGFIISFFSPMLQYFRFIYLIPIMAILLSFSLSQGHRLHRFGVVMVGGFIIFSLTYLLLPQFHREDWKSLVKNLPKNKPVYMITASSDPVKYYNNSLRINELTRLRPAQRDFGGQSGLEKEIVVIPYTADIYGFDYKKILKENNYYLTSKKTFLGLELEFFVFNN